MSTIEIRHFLRDMDTQQLKNGLNYTITEHEIVSTLTAGCYGTDKMLWNMCLMEYLEFSWIQFYKTFWW